MKEYKCVGCGKKVSYKLSKNDLCIKCATLCMMENARQLKVKKGPYYEKWKAGVKAHAKDLE